MEILQHYYTSYINRETGSAGFQVKAMSPSISPDTQNMILRLIAYRIPSSLDERAFQTHPRALRYYLFNEHEGLLISSRSNGSDPNGRPGNFFAHTLVVDPQVFTTVPPILYWESEFWRTQDAETPTKLQTLSDLPGDPALDIDAMWTFLQTGKQRAIFLKLMCAVVQGTSSRRRIIIIDSDEHVAFWIAAISCMLPPAYRPLLSFTTYHHDPYQSQFFITGTPPSLELRLAAEDYQSYFIVNTPENKISAIDRSLYAELAHMYATPEQADNEMLTFFARYAHRFPTPTVIDEQLDSIALYARIMRKDGDLSYSANELRAISQALPTFEHLKYYEAHDIKDLKLLDSFLRRFYQVSDNHEAELLRLRIVTLLDQHKVPTDEIFKQDLADYTRRIFGTYASDIATIALKGIERLLQNYGEEKFIDYVNQGDYLAMLSEHVIQAQVSHLIRVWQSVGPYLLPHTATRIIFAQSIYAWGHYIGNPAKNNPQHTKAASALFAAMQSAIAARGPAWFNLLIANSSLQTLPLEPRYLILFYCELMVPLSLAQREPYRNVLYPIFNDVVDSEFAYDLSQIDVQTMLPTIKKWVIYAQQTQLREPAALVAQGLAILRNHYQTKPTQWGAIARQCLVDPQLTPVLGQWEARLLADAFSALSLSQFDLEHLPLYRQYCHHESLAAQNRTIINAFLAMHDRHLDPQLAEELYQYVTSLSREAYYTELSSFCSYFFTEQLSDDDHFSLLSAFFIWPHESIFWQVYWEKVCVQPEETVVRLLAFWFTPRPTHLAQAYVAQGFLLTLQHHLQQSQKIPDFQKILTQITHYAWYTAIHDSILVRKNVLQTMGKGLMKQVQKRLPNQKTDDETAEREQQLQNEMRKLFEKGRIRDAHLSQLMHVYQIYTPPTYFWEAYKERLIQLLLSNDAEHALEFFSFWFNESFTSFAYQPFLAQSFFIGLPQVFELACKENEGELRKISQMMSARVDLAHTPYYWYALIVSFLPEQQTTEQRSRKFKR